jgi:hypothetical protein
MPLRPRRSKCSDQQFIDAVQSSVSVAEVLRRLNLTPSGANYKFVHSWVARLSLETAHLLGQGHLKGKSHSWAEKTPTDAILVENSTYANTSALKARLIREGVLESRCGECGISEWQGRPLSLVLDHLNGVNNDHRRDNLRLLCPNCHSLTDTFAGRNKGKLLSTRQAAMRLSRDAQETGS